MDVHSTSCILASVPTTGLLYGELRLAREIYLNIKFGRQRMKELYLCNAHETSVLRPALSVIQSLSAACKQVLWNSNAAKKGSSLLFRPRLLSENGAQLDSLIALSFDTGVAAAPTPEIGKTAQKSETRVRLSRKGHEGHLLCFPTLSISWSFRNGSLKGHER